MYTLELDPRAIEAVLCKYQTEESAVKAAKEIAEKYKTNVKVYKLIRKFTLEVKEEYVEK
jgi:uncharacterized protein with PhoU and TrkA domain